MAEERDGCAKPAAGPIMEGPAETVTVVETEVVKVQARVGREAPDFEANGYFVGEGFKQLRLSDYKGKWIVLCFYPGDFTFV